MPQMAPMWWTTMFTVFTMLFLMSNAMLYFQKQYNPTPNTKKSNYSNMMNWKW